MEFDEEHSLPLERNTEKVEKDTGIHKGMKQHKVEREKRAKVSGKWENVMKTNKGNGAMPRVRKCGFLVLVIGMKMVVGAAFLRP